MKKMFLTPLGVLGFLCLASAPWAVSVNPIVLGEVEGQLVGVKDPKESATLIHILEDPETKDVTFLFNDLNGLVITPMGAEDLGALKEILTAWRHNSGIAAPNPDKTLLGKLEAISAFRKGKGPKFVILGANLAFYFIRDSSKGLPVLLVDYLSLAKPGESKGLNLHNLVIAAGGVEAFQKALSATGRKKP